MLAFYCYNFLIINLQLTSCLTFDTETHLDIFRTCFKTILMFNPMTPNPLLQTNFAQKALDYMYLFNWNSFSRVGTTNYNKMPLTLRNLSK